MQIAVRRRLVVASTLLALSASAWAGAVIENFEMGTIPPGWTTTGNAWTVGGTAGAGVVIHPPEGKYFARSGAPNSTGSIGESNTGTLLSPALKVMDDKIAWSLVGWSGQYNNGASRVEILSESMDMLAKVQMPQSDRWRTTSVDLFSLGLAAGDTFYFRAIDGNAGYGYAWFAIDNIHFVGNPVPEPDTGMLLACGLAGLIVLARARARQPSRSGG